MWNPADAIFSMANYLRADGAPADYRRAIFDYNHAWWYVDEVLWWANRYRATYEHNLTPSLP
jgi:membrane-bound lytic murein transglycosylase B